MAKKKIKHIFVLFITLLVLFYFAVNATIGKDNTILQKIKIAIPQNIKLLLKETVFIFPTYKKLKKDAQEATKKTNDLYGKIYTNPLIYDHIQNYLKPKNIAELANTRSLIIKNFILDESEVSFEKVINSNWNFKGKRPKNDHEVFKLQYYKLNHFGVLEKTNLDQKKLLVYIQGHRGDSYNDQSFLDMINKFKDEKYDILTLGMTGLSYNENNKINFPNYKKKSNPSSHKTYSTYFDKNFPNKKPLSLMLSGNYYLIKKLIKQNNYKEIVMVGLSGGGWYTTLLSSIITEVNSSYSFAGTFPLFFRIFDAHAYDWEQVDSSLYENVDYNSLYILSTLNEEYKVTRKHYQVFNDRDPCCFRNPSATILKNMYENYDIKNFKISVVDNNEHSIDTKFLFKSFFNSQ